MTRRAGITWVIAALAAAGIAMIAVGVADGEAKLTYAKAVRVCLECIGIG